MIKLNNILKEVYFSGFITSEATSRFAQPENFDKYAEGKGWTAWRGGNNCENGSTAAAIVFEGDDKSRMWFTVKYPESISRFVEESLSVDHPVVERINKLGRRITNKWIREAQKIHRVPKDHFPDGKPWKRDWKECFVMALGSKAMKPYIKECGIDYTKWHSMKREQKVYNPNAANEKHQ